MKKVFNFAAILTIAGFIIAGCNKSADEPAPAPSFSGESFAKHLMTPEGSTAFANALAEQTDVSQLKSGSEFMVPFYSSDGFGVIKNLVFDPSIPAIVSGELGFFSAEYDENDFWRLNPDSTISIHLTSNEALGEYLDFATGMYLTGDQCRLNMNYTGELIEIIVPFPPYVLYFISTVNPPAMVYNGNGKVQENGSGPKYDLRAQVLINKKGLIHVTLSLD